MGLLQALFGGQQEQQPQTLVQSILASRFQQPQQQPPQIFSPEVLSSLNQNLQPTMQDIGNAAISRFANKNPTITAEQMAETRVKQPLEMMKGLSEINRNNAMAGLNGSGGAMNLAVSKIMQENPGMGFTQAYNIVKTGLGQGVTYENGTVTPMKGAPEAVGAMQYGKESGGNRSDLQYKPQIAGAESEQSKIGEARGSAKGAVEKKAVQAPQIIDLLNEAETLLPNATSGGLATTGRDTGAYMGYATKGSKADSQLNVISAGLVANVPRMEGPQSDKDVMMYKQAAGDLANTGLPVETRMAAINTMRKLQQKYISGDKGTFAPSNNSGWSIREIK